MASCAALLAMIIALLFGGSPTAATPTTGAPPAQATQATGAADSSTE